jgi:hypothetical protein
MGRALAAMLAASAMLSTVSSAVSAGSPDADTLSDPLKAEEAFASLLFGRYFRDPCAGSSDSSTHCATGFAERHVVYQDARSRQSYTFTENPCIIEAVSQSAASGKSYKATFHLENAERIFPGDIRENGQSKEYAFTFQGKGVVDFDGKGSDMLIFLHKYHVGANGLPSHDMRAELSAMQDLLKRYQARFCPGSA